jgi:hypothetical protein
MAESEAQRVKVIRDSGESPAVVQDPGQIPSDRDEYQKLLEEKARLDGEYDHLFFRALAYGAPLTVCDEAKPSIPVATNIGDLNAFIGDPTFVPRSCTWNVQATLYEVTNPWSLDENERGRTLVLPASGGSRHDLASIDSEALCYPEGPRDNSLWRARAAEVGY